MGTAAAIAEKTRDFFEWIRSASSSFAEVQLTPPLKAAEVITIDCNHLNPLEFNEGYYSGFRFKSPSEPGSLVWLFTYDPDRSLLESWNIIPRAKEQGLGGFKTFFKIVEPSRLPGDEKPWPSNYRGIAQQLPQSLLQPSTEYVMWFRFKSTKPTSIYATLKVIPLSGDLDEKTVLDLIRLK